MESVKRSNGVGASPGHLALLCTSMTAVTEHTQTVLPTQTVVFNYHDPSREPIACWDYYQEATAGETLRELPPPFPPGTRANVIKAYVSEDNPSVFVIEIANIKTLAVDD